VVCGSSKNNLPKVSSTPVRLQILVGFLFSFAVLSSYSAVLPEPLTLEYVLQMDVAFHPDIQSATANLQLHYSDQQRVNAVDDFAAQLQARAQLIEPAQSAPDKSRGDHHVSLLLRKQLYDFGRSRAAQAAVSASVESSELILFDVINQHRLVVMTDFFDVLLADLKFIHANEAMSIAYVRLDRARSRNELGQLSDIELSALESRYQQTRLDYAIAQSLQRNTRAQLANVLNRPGDLVSDVAEPKLFFINEKFIEKKRLSVKEYQHQAAKNNPVLRALRAQMNAAERQVQASRANKNPMLGSELAISEYARESASHDKWRASIILDVPLLVGDRVNAQVAKRQAEKRVIQSRLHAAEMNIAQSVLETWQHLETMKISHQHAKAQAEFRDLYLDRSRALYEMEVESDLGDAMVNISEVRIQLAKVKYQIVMAWARLQALIGNKVTFPKEADGVNNN